MMHKKVILAIIILLLVVGIYQGFFKKEKPVLTLAEVSRGDVAQEVSATGQVTKGQEINLSFKTAGRIEKIYVEVGQKVKEGEKLAKLDTTQLQIQLQEAKAALDLAQAKLNKLLAGPSSEEIQLAETKVSNAKISLQAAQQNLEDVKAQANEALTTVYQDALNILDDSYLKAYNAFNVVDSIQRTYFTVNDQESIRVRENKEKIKNAVLAIKHYLDIAKTDSKNENIDKALSETKKSLKEISETLKIIRETCEEPIYQNKVSATDKASLDTQRGYINTALTNVTNSQQTISSTKLTNQANINTASANLSLAEGSLKAAQDELALLLAPSRQEDIDLYQAQVNQAKSQLNLLENQIEESILISPTRGQVIKIAKRVGETVQPMMGEVILTLLPAKPFQIEVDIPEAEIGKIEIGDSCKIILDAFPEKEFSGKVIEIEPSATIIQGVVYYRVKTSIEGELSKIKPGMTANVTIISERKENVLIIPQRAVIEKDGKKFVRVPSGDTFEEVEVQTGLKGSEGEVEIISGLEEGDKVITFIKKK